MGKRSSAAIPLIRLGKFGKQNVCEWGVSRYCRSAQLSPLTGFARLSIVSPSDTESSDGIELVRYLRGYGQGRPFSLFVIDQVLTCQPVRSTAAAVLHEVQIAGLCSCLPAVL